MPTLASDELIEVPIGQRQLFLDDYGISEQANLRRTMHSPEKRGAVVVPDRPWEKWIQTRSAPAWDQERQLFKLWLITCPDDPAFAGNAYAESTDGLHWKKPMLRQREYQGSTENNFLVVDPQLPRSASSIEGVVCDAKDHDPQRRYKGLIGAEYREPVFSPDGIHWQRSNGVRLTASDEGSLCYDPATLSFIAALKTFTRHGRAHAIWTSKDFVHWTRLPEVFHADDEDQRLAREVIRERFADAHVQQPVSNDPAQYHADIYNLAIFPYEGMYVGLPAVYYATGKDRAGTNTDGFHLIQLACSRDLQRWQRLGQRQAFIGPSPIGSGAYDLTQLLPAGAPLIRGDEIWIYYSGLKYREPPVEGADPKQGAVCLAVLRRDGFISMDAGDAPGTLLTKTFVLQGGGIFVNVDASAGSLNAELLSPDEKVLATSKVVVGNQWSAKLRWDATELPALSRMPVRLRFTLRNARLYSFWLADHPAND